MVVCEILTGLEENDQVFISFLLVDPLNFSPENFLTNMADFKWYETAKDPHYYWKKLKVTI